MNEAPHKTDVAAVGRRIVRGMLVIVFYYAFLKAGGFLMNLLIVNYFKDDAIKNAYASVYGVLLYPLVFSTALKVLLPAFMPLFSQERDNVDEQRAWDMASTSSTDEIPLAMAPATQASFRPCVARNSGSPRLPRRRGAAWPRTARSPS